MKVLNLVGLIFMMTVSLVFSFLAFMGKPIILDNAYTKASKEEQEKMDKKAYRLQSAIIFLFIGLVSLSNVLRIVLQIAWFTYVGLGLGAIGIVYAIISHYTIKNKSK
ncbi:MAG: DUF3784 domain-containing protein [Clostridia bacterium]|nr:DUF3784 domain-containing protein [Clostridia bacterium]